MEVTEKFDSPTGERIWIARIGANQFCLSWDEIFREVTIMAWGDTPDSEVEQLSAGHNRPMQQAGAAGIISVIRKLLERGSGR